MLGADARDGEPEVERGGGGMSSVRARRPAEPPRSCCGPARAGALGLYGLGALAGCTVERPIDKPEGRRLAKPEIDGDLLIYNWAQYMDPDIKKGFSEKYGVEVNEVNFDNLEAMVTKLRAGGRYDMIWPTPEYAFRLDQEGLLDPLRPRRRCRTRRGSRPSTTPAGGTRTASSPSPTPTTRPESPGATTRSRA